MLEAEVELIALQPSATTSEPAAHVMRPLIPLVVVQPVPLAMPPGPVQYGMELEVALKSDGFPKKSQRSAFSWTLLKSFDPSMMFQGCGPAKVMMVLSFQPSSIWPNAFLP